MTDLTSSLKINKRGLFVMTKKLLIMVAAVVLSGGSLLADDSMKLTVGHDMWIGYAGYFVAKDQGFFEEAGLEIDAKPFANPGETLPAMIVGPPGSCNVHLA